MHHVLILGCGFTGQRVARRFLARGASVTVTTRAPPPAWRPWAPASSPSTISPPIFTPESWSSTQSALRCHLDLLYAPGAAPARVVYLSTTAVYGSATHVDASTPVDWESDRARPRLEAEQRVAAGPWSSLILRPAAIYGPGRGVQESLPRGAYYAGDNYVSRIHVDDLAAHAEAALLSDLEGAYPVADEEPCTTREIAEFCARLLHLPSVPQPAPGTKARATSNRRVDGSAIRRALGTAPVLSHLPHRHPRLADHTPALTSIPYSITSRFNFSSHSPPHAHNANVVRACAGRSL